MIYLSNDGVLVKNGCKEFVGLSRDKKPTDKEVGDGSTFLELDTKKAFMFMEGTWYEL